MVAAGATIYAEDINERGIKYYGNRPVGSPAGPTSGGTLLGVERIDNMTLKAGYLYQVICGNVRPDLTVPGDGVKIDLRYNPSGVATSASTEIGRSETNVSIDTDNMPPPFGWIIPVTTTTTGSVLLGLTRFSGTGTISLTGDVGGIWLMVICHGPAPADSGVDV